MNQPPINYLPTGPSPAPAVRLCMARRKGHGVDGAWWLRTERMTSELPQVLSLLTPVLGQVTSINVNWPPLQRPPDLNLPGWQAKHQHVMTITSNDACAKLLIIPRSTRGALALMVLRRSANLAIDAVDRETPAYMTAGIILLAAQLQCAPVRIGHPARGHRNVDAIWASEQNP